VTTSQVRPAAAGDVPAAAAVLAHAFTDYPWTRWTVDADRRRWRLTQLYRLYLTAVALPYGHVDLVGAVDGPLSVAVWLPSGGVPDHVWAEIAPAAADLAGDRAAAAAAAHAAVAARRASEEHLLLAALGVVPEQQGRGLGAMLLAAGLQRAERHGLPVHLETSAPRNVRFYRRFGFAEAAVLDLPGGGPRTWLMRRGPNRWRPARRGPAGANPGEIAGSTPAAAANDQP
jgi:GNAT superfamily N-acetyltransferase